MNLLFTHKITSYFFKDLLKNWLIIGYTIFLTAVSFGLFMMENHPEKAFLAILNVVLLSAPLVCIVFSTIYYYNSYEFISLLLAQPIKRIYILLSLYFGLTGVFLLVHMIGIGIPLFIYFPEEKSLIFFIASVLLSLVFISLAFLGGIAARDKSKGIGIALMLWIYFVLLFDGLILLLMYNFSDYPIEKLVVFISFLNPVDLTRILVLMQTEASALMGYSGALFKNLFGNFKGELISVIIIFLWAFFPMILALRYYRSRDL